MSPNLKWKYHNFKVFYFILAKIIFLRRVKVSKVGWSENGGINIQIFKRRRFESGLRSLLSCFGI